MDQYEAVIKLLIEAVKESVSEGTDDTIPVGVSNRHVHLSQKDLEALFGPGYELAKMKDLSQPGQYACKETVTICGPKGPGRGRTQVEILAGDSFKLGIKPTAKLSGDLDGTPGVTIIGPKGSVQTKDGVMVAQRHIHMLPEDAARLGVHDGQNVSLEVDGIRGGVLRNTIVRVTSQSGLECHVDTEEANAMGLSSSSRVRIVQ